MCTLQHVKLARMSAFRSIISNELEECSNYKSAPGHKGGSYDFVFINAKKCAYCILRACTHKPLFSINTQYFLEIWQKLKDQQSTMNIHSELTGSALLFVCF